MVSEILIGIAGILILGNVGYYFWSKRNETKAEKVSNNPFEKEKASKALSEDNPYHGTVQGSHSATDMGISVSNTDDKQWKSMNSNMLKISEGMKAVSTKTDFIYKKVIRLEDYNEKNKAPANLRKIEKKIDKLDEFRRNTTIELEAIKDRLKEVNILESKKNGSEKIEDPAMKEKIRKLVFNNRH